MMSDYYLIRENIFKALAEKQGKTLIINCSMKRMPEWVEAKLLREVTRIDEEEAFIKKPTRHMIKRVTISFI